MKEEVRAILRNADQFADAARLINLEGRRTGQPFHHLAAQGAILAFATELMLKALHLIELNTTVKGHDLWKLYESLPAHVKQAVHREWIEGASDFDRTVDDHMASMGVPVPNLEDSIKGGRNAFELLRYMHEGKLPENLGLGRVMATIRRYLFRRYSTEQDIWLCGLNG